VEEAQGRQEKVQQERERLERAARCNSQRRVATSMLTTDISLPVLGHILDYIIGLLYCQFSAVGGASTVKHHWKQSPPEIRMSKWKIGHSNPEFEG